MRKLVVVLSALGIIALSVGLAIFFAKMKKKKKKKPVQKIIKLVHVTDVSYGNVPTFIKAFGRVESAQKLTIQSEVSGRMIRGAVPLKAGQNFSKGSLLFKVDDREASLSLKSQKSTFLKSLSLILPDLKVDYPNRYQIWSNYASSLDFDRSFPELPVAATSQEKNFLATKGIYSAYYTIKSAEQRLNKHRYYAPFTGSISAINLQAGSFVNPGSNIGTIIRTSSNELKATIGINDAKYLKKGQLVEVFSKNSANKWQGKVLRVANYVNEKTQSVDAFIQIFPNENPIFPGQFMTVKIPTKSVANAMLVPRDIIYEGGKVYTVKNDSLLDIKQVQVLRNLGDKVVISGLEKGEKLVNEQVIGGYKNMPVKMTAE